MRSEHEIEIPKLGIFRLSIHVADLLLVSEGSIEWVREPRVRRVWHALFFSTLAIAAAVLLVRPFLSDALAHSPELTLAWRVLMVACWSWLLGLLVLLSYRHYRYLILHSLDLRLQSTVVFYATGVILFSYLYRALYVLDPSLFHYPASPVVPTATATPLGFLQGLESGLQFMVYSACTAVTLAFPHISSASIVVSTLNFVEVILSLLTFGVVIATLIQRSSQAA